MSQPIVNLQDYTVADHLLFGIGCLLWVIVYILVIRNIRRYQYVEIPLMAIAINFAWETLWSWVFTTDMGLLYVWGYRAWFFLDCYIVYHAFKYGFKQLPDYLPRVFARYILVFFWSAWMFVLYFFTVKFDLPQSRMGGYGGYWCNFLMSVVYIPLILRTAHNLQYFSLANAWLKGLGTFLVTLFCFNHAAWRGEWFLYSLGIVVAILDAYYIYTFYLLRKKANTHVSMG